MSSLSRTTRQQKETAPDHTPRRARGTGSISYLRNGTVQGALDLGTVDGKRTRVFVYGETEADVEAQFTELRRKADLGLDVHAAQETVVEYLNKWLSSKRRIRESTRKSYADQIRLHIQPDLGRRKLAELKTQHIQAWVNNLEEKTLAPRTIKYTFDILRSALNQAVKWGILERNPAAAVETPTVEPFDAYPLELTEAEQILDAADGHRMKIVYETMVALGLRPKEIIELEWTTVDLEKGTLFIPRGKTRRSRRTLQLPQFLVERLRAHQEQQQHELRAMGRAWREHGPVFTSNVGTSLIARNLTRDFKQTLQRAGFSAEKMRRIRLYDLRHACASFLAHKKVHPSVVQRIMGHEHISTTLQYYTHVIGDDQRCALESLGDLFEG